MSMRGVKDFLQQWQPKACNNLTCNFVVPITPLLPRSFRPHRIVPRVFLGKLEDAEDILTLRRRLLPENMLLVVSTCERNGPPRLEMLRVSPLVSGDKEREKRAAKTREKQKIYKVLQLAVCSWERLEEIFRYPHSGECADDAQVKKEDLALMTTTMWLKAALESFSFDGNSSSYMHAAQNRDNIEESMNSADVVYLKLSLPWKDEPSFHVKGHFDVATSLMRVVTCELEGAVVCYCVAGISRSATLVCAFLLRCWCTECSEGNNLYAACDVVREVIEFVREIRPCVCPNEGFTQQLIEYTNMLFFAR